jgi:hypothetical protein
MLAITQTPGRDPLPHTAPYRNVLRVALGALLGSCDFTFPFLEVGYGGS